MNSHRSSVSPVFLHGFLPAEEPLDRLPNEARCSISLELNLTLFQLPALLAAKKFRLVIDELNNKYVAAPLIMMDKFNPVEVNAAFAMLTMLVQAYVWEAPGQPARTIPPILSENLFSLMKICPRMPVLTYADYILYNWRLVDKNKGITLDNVEPIFTFTANEDEAWFIKIHVVVEEAFKEAIAAAGSIHSLAKAPYQENSKNIFSKHFAVMSHSIERATAVIARMYEKCTPTFFSKILRPYLEGTEKADGIQFVFQGNQSPTYFHRGSSGAQSSTVPALDAILNVRHENDQMGKSLQGFLEYMPVAHKTLILQLQQNNVASVVKEFKEVAQKCGEAINQLAIFRTKHIDMTAKYIMQQALEQGIPLEQVTGTGSTSIGMFLGKRTEDTRKAAVKTGWKPQSKL